MRPTASATKVPAYILRDRGRPFESELAGLRLSPLWLLGLLSGSRLSRPMLPHAADLFGGDQAFETDGWKALALVRSIAFRAS